MYSIVSQRWNKTIAQHQWAAAKRDDIIKKKPTHHKLNYYIVKYMGCYNVNLKKTIIVYNLNITYCCERHDVSRPYSTIL